MTEFAFDVKFLAAIRVNAPDEQTARKMLREHLGCTDSNLGAWDNGEPILCELGIDGEADLYEVDGEAV